MGSLPTMAGGKPRKSVHFSDNSNIVSFNPNQQHDRSPSAASDDTNETIRPERPSPYIHDGSLDLSPDNGDFSSSQSTLLSNAEPLLMANASSSFVPLLSRQSPSPSSSVSEIESQSAPGSQLVGYGTTISPFSTRAVLQQPQSTSYRYPPGQIEVDQDVHLRWRFVWRWLQVTSPATQGVNEPGSTTNEEGAHSRCESDDSFTGNRSNKVTDGFRMFISKIHVLCNSAEQSTTTVTMVQIAKSLSFMLVLAVVVFAIGYGVYELAKMGRSDR